MQETAMELNHFSHPHPLVLLEGETDGMTIISYCSICKARVEGYSYNCLQCYFCLDKHCAELQREIIHPFHLGHPLILTGDWKKKRPLLSGISSSHCKSCRKSYELYEDSFFYRCSACDFDLDIRCVLLPKFITGEFPKRKHFSHEHLLFFIQNHYIEPKDLSCSACEEPIAGPVYCCFDCQFFLHQKCFKLPRNIRHPSHRKHSLALLPNPPPHPERCSCHLCTKAYRGFMYYCSLCEFGIMVKYTFSDQKVITSKFHKHPFNLTPRPASSFICDACGTDGNYCIPYLCAECDIAVHKDCISLPQNITLTSHDHPVSHVYYFQEEKQVKKRSCRICQNEINTEFGCYHCPGCEYFVHVNCAMKKDIFIQESEATDENQNLDQINLGCLSTKSSIIRVLRPKRIGGEVKAREIEHFSHGCKLRLCDDVKDEKCCDGCRRFISNSFYHCAECNYILHENCANLPRRARHWAFKDTFSLQFYKHFKCWLCCFYRSGLVYVNDEGSRQCCIPCFVIPSRVTYPGHDEHQVTFDEEFTFKCSICDDGHQKQGAFRCNFQGCDFVVDRTSLVLPTRAWHKMDQHPLSLTHSIQYREQCICDICEEPREPNELFYYCKTCDNSAHYLCVLGRHPFVRLGLTNKYGFHEHPLTVAKEKNYSDHPKCSVCGKPCKDVFFKCTECEYFIHWECRKPLGN